MLLVMRLMLRRMTEFDLLWPVWECNMITTGKQGL